jgi:predicted alpha/beta hydrolase family esterase
VKRILVIHGWGNHRPAGHWHRELVTSLRNQGHVVSCPALPDADLPTLSKWLEVVAQELEMLQEVQGDELVVVAHSLGVLTWLHACQSALVSRPVDRVLLVGPADPAMCAEVPTFDIDIAQAREPLANTARSVILVGSDADPWAPRGIVETFATPLNQPVVIIPGAGHIAMDDGYGHWQGVIDWVNDPNADLTKK